MVGGVNARHGVAKGGVPRCGKCESRWRDIARLANLRRNTTHARRTPMAAAMRLTRSFVLAMAGCAVAASANAATIAGTVTGPDGKAFRGAFVQAKNLKTKIMVSVLSDKAGKYAIENLPAGDYRLGLRAIGFTSDPKTGIALAADQ